MIAVLRGDERRHLRGHRWDVWKSIVAGENGRRLGTGHGVLEDFDESRLLPGAGTLRLSDRNAELLILLRSGALAWQDTAGNSGQVQAGELWRGTATRGLRLDLAKASRGHGAQLIQIRLRSPRPKLETGYEQKRFSAADRRGRLCIVASPDGRRASLRVQGDVLVFSSWLDPGTHVTHELLPGRSAWLHVMAGEATLGEVVLRSGDSAGLSSELAVSLTAVQETELLLLDLGPSSQLA